MKAHREEPKPQFKPVILTLETQEEVDGIFALLDHATISEAVGLGDDAPMEALQPFHSDKCDELHRNLQRLVG